MSLSSESYTPESKSLNVPHAFLLKRRIPVDQHLKAVVEMVGDLVADTQSDPSILQDPEHAGHLLPLYSRLEEDSRWNYSTRRTKEDPEITKRNEYLIGQAIVRAASNPDPERPCIKMVAEHLIDTAKNAPHLRRRAPLLSLLSLH